MGTERDDGIRPELQDQAVERFVETELVETEEVAPWPEEAPWAHTEVRGRYPAGTDPFLALKDAMGVFMERADGTNAMPWWQLNGLRWWHAGLPGLKRGDKILPPAVTGVMPALESDREAVYVTSERAEAVMYAAQHLGTDTRRSAWPVLYEVMLDGEPQPDDTQPGSETSFRVPSATIRRIEQPSRIELSNVIAEILELNRQQLATALVEEAEEETRKAADDA